MSSFSKRSVSTKFRLPKSFEAKKMGFINFGSSENNYQPSGEGGTRSTPATPHHLTNLTDYF